jgi:hypothetical protein
VGSIFAWEPREAGEAAGEASVVNLDRNLDGERGAASWLPLMTGITP